VSLLVVAPHADDETLGCGGLLLREASAGHELHWLLLTSMSTEAGWPEDRVALRTREIEAVHAAYGFASRSELGYAPATLDTVSQAELVGRIGEVIGRVAAEDVYVPWRGDTHSDHRVTFDASCAAAKGFRQPSVRRVLAYETPSETDFGLDPDGTFAPNVFVDIAGHLDRKLEVLSLYDGEIGPHPFPRGPRAVAALADVRGAAAGREHAEAFRLLREVR
jgi:LmbE family N-acetylglucosaminyl deacetylase